MSDLYIQQIKLFKPTPVSADQSEGVKKFSLPGKPTIPSDEISTDAIKEYEAEEVETKTVSTSAEPAHEEDWFVFEEQEEAH